MNRSILYYGNQLDLYLFIDFPFIWGFVFNILPQEIEVLGTNMIIKTLEFLLVFKNFTKIWTITRIK